MARRPPGADRRRDGRGHEGDHRQDLRTVSAPRAVLFAGCAPEVAADPRGRILAVGAGARAAAGRGAEVIRLRGEAWPGLIDAHIHVDGLAERRLDLDLSGSRSPAGALQRVA